MVVGCVIRGIRGRETTIILPLLDKAKTHGDTAKAEAFFSCLPVGGGGGCELLAAFTSASSLIQRVRLHVGSYQMDLSS